MRKEYLICIDSDGCAMDTMELKHLRCFGPCIIKEWELEEWELPILKQWNDMNLYRITRGINRFRGLSLLLRRVHEDYCEIEGIELLEDWVNRTKEFSISSIKKESPHLIFEKVIHWSDMVNQEIDAIPMSKKRPFEGVKEALQDANSFADVVIVSSANRKAVVEEWEYHKLLLCVKRVMTQEDGTKKECIRKLLSEGYAKRNVLMIGDSKGDLEAAISNGISFYPILANREKCSWREFCNTALDKFRNGAYQGAYEEVQTQRFFENLRGEM